MQTEPPKAEPPKLKRRWYQFSLRALMIVVTLVAAVCGYVGWQATIVRERDAMLARIEKEGGSYIEANSRHRHRNPWTGPGVVVALG